MKLFTLNFLQFLLCSVCSAFNFQWNSKFANLSLVEITKFFICLFLLLFLVLVFFPLILTELGLWVVLYIYIYLCKGIDFLFFLVILPFSLLKQLIVFLFSFLKKIFIYIGDSWIFKLFIRCFIAFFEDPMFLWIIIPILAYIVDWILWFILTYISACYGILWNIFIRNILKEWINKLLDWLETKPAFCRFERAFIFWSEDPMFFWFFCEIAAIIIESLIFLFQINFFLEVWIIWGFFLKKLNYFDFKIVFTSENIIFLFLKTFFFLPLYLFVLCVEFLIELFYNIFEKFLFFWVKFCALMNKYDICFEPYDPIFFRYVIILIGSLLLRLIELIKTLHLDKKFICFLNFINEKQLVSIAKINLENHFFFKMLLIFIGYILFIFYRIGYIFFVTLKFILRIIRFISFEVIGRFLRWIDQLLILFEDRVLWALRNKCVALFFSIISWIYFLGFEIKDCFCKRAKQNFKNFSTTIDFISRWFVNFTILICWGTMFYFFGAEFYEAIKIVFVIVWHDLNSYTAEIEPWADLFSFYLYLDPYRVHKRILMLLAFLFAWSQVSPETFWITLYAFCGWYCLLTILFWIPDVFFAIISDDNAGVAMPWKHMIMTGDPLLAVIIFFFFFCFYIIIEKPCYGSYLFNK